MTSASRCHDADPDAEARASPASAGALVILTATLVQFKLPLEGAAILLAIDQILDMGRTSVNVMGNCIAAAVVARWEGVFDDETMRRSWEAA
jgi:Na+/H+-dicarboxylate symporter